MASLGLNGPGIILGKGSVSKRRRYNVTSSLIGCARTNTDPDNRSKYQEEYTRLLCIFYIYFVKISLNIVP